MIKKLSKSAKAWPGRTGQALAAEGHDGDIPWCSAYSLAFYVTAMMLLLPAVVVNACVVCSCAVIKNFDLTVDWCIKHVYFSSI